jgi:diacylglycerol kinase (ATP)
MKHLVFIINPHSGVDRQKAMQMAIDEVIDKSQFTYEIAFTEYAKHGIELARTAALKGAYAVVAVGGDGSVNDVVKGLLGTETALAIIPKGSGNGMARCMNIPLKERAALEVINKGRTERMDIAYANDQPFISNAGVAFDALISKKFATSKRRGMLVYGWLVTKHLWLYRTRKWNMNIDGEESTVRAFMIVVANGDEFGYGYKIAPGASWTDGLFDVIVVKKFPKIYGGLMAMRLRQGTITDSKYVERYRGKEITLSHPQLSLMQVDGDSHPCENKITFKLEAGKQKVIVP